MRGDQGVRPSDPPTNQVTAKFVQLNLWTRRGARGDPHPVHGPTLMLQNLLRSVIK